MSSSATVVPFYFDPISPFSWLASRQLPRLQQAGLTIDARPVLFAGLLNAHGQKGPAEIPAKRVAMFQDVWRQAEQLGLPCEGPPSHPFNPLRALRMCIAVRDPAARLRLACAMMQACWEQGADLSDATTLDAIAANCGLAGLALGQAAESPQVKAQLLEATNAAIAAGIFGVPTLVWHGDMFWGSDRIDALLWRLEHPVSRQDSLERFLQRGASAQRVRA